MIFSVIHVDSVVGLVKGCWRDAGGVQRNNETMHLIQTFIDRVGDIL